MSFPLSCRGGDHCDPTDAPPAAGGREHPHHARGGRRVRAPGDALLDRQGQRRDAAPGAEGVLPVAAAVPAAARRHDLEVPGDVRVPRPHGGRGSAWSCSSTRTPRACASASTRSTTARVHTDMWKTEGLKQALDQYGFDAAFGGARRDEEKSRAKERIFSFRSAQHRWDPKQQRPELWRLYNARKHQGRDASGCSRSRTGPSSTSGSTSTSRTSRSCRSTSRRRGRWSSATAR